MANEFIVKNGLIAQNNITVTGSINATSGITGSLSGTAATASYIATAQTSSYILNAQSASYILNAQSASLASTASYALTSSYANAFTVGGTLTAQTLVVQTITSSQDFVTGSTKFGSISANTHQFTGSIGMSGSLNVVGASSLNTATVSGSLTVSGSGTIASYNSDVLEITGSLAVSGSSTVTGNHSVSGSMLVIGSTTMRGNQVITGSLTATAASTFLSSITNVSALYVRASDNSDLPFINFSNADGVYNWGRVGGLLQGNGDGSLYFQTKTGGGLTTKLTISSTGASIFASSITSSGMHSINSGVDASYQDAFVGTYSSNNNEQNAIQTSVSSTAQNSGFRFQASNGGGSTGRTTVADFLRDRQIFYHNVIPAANGTQDLGTSSLRWATVYTSDLDMSNGIGDYTIVEGEDDLFLYNNKKGKVYKFVIQEVDPSEATPKMKK